MNNSPFEIFRKNLKPLMVLLIMLAMFSFVVLPALDTYLRQGAGGGGDTKLASFDGIEISQNRVSYMTQNHQSMVRFLRELAERTILEGGSPKTPGFRYDEQNKRVGALGISEMPSEQLSLKTMQFASEANKAGFELDNAAIGAWLNMFVDNRFSDKQIDAMLMESTRNQMGRVHLYEQLRMHLLADIYNRTGFAVVAAGQMPIMTPAEEWNNFLKLNREATVTAYGIPVETFVSKTDANPSESDIQAMYEEGKDTDPNDQSPRPAFHRQYTAQFEYLVGDLQSFIDAEAVKFSEEELRAEYERRLAGGDFKLPVDPAEQAAADATMSDDLETEADTVEVKVEEMEAKPADAPAAKEDAAKEDAKPEAKKPEAKEEVKKEEPAKADSEEAKNSEESAPESDATSEETPADEDKTSRRRPMNTANSAVRLVAFQEASDEPADDVSKETPAEPKPEEKPEAKPADAAPSDEKPAEKPAEKPKSDDKPADKPKAADKPAEEAKPEMKEAPAKEAPAKEAPAKEEPAKEEPADAKETPKAEMAAEAKPAETKPAAEKKPETESFEAVREQIADSLARPIAEANMNKAMAEMFSQMRRYFNQHAIHSSDKRNGLEVEELAPFDLKKLGESFGFRYQKIGSNTEFSIEAEPIAQSLEVGSQQLSRGPSFTSFMYGGQTQMGPVPRQLLYSPLRTVDDRGGKTYISWKTGEQKAYTPKLEEVRDEVIAAIRFREARKLALEAAVELADKANKDGLELSELVPAENKDDVQSGLGPFSWMDSFGFQGASIGNVPELNSVGQEFMKAVFTSEVGEYAVAMNLPESVVYVAKPTNFQPSMDDLKALFQNPRERMMAMLAGGGSTNEVVQGFYEAVDKRTDFSYAREPEADDDSQF
ncbi:hypothetical protein Pla52o_00990 [Novipirellula galeiformis]|uniref:Periplasmic folding chaperone n=1 Tax=Novipirellula galeiformis TaxID=2528004 RepID=A0A5C6CT67_9BACT|nr:hypothetical protein [Novipirellula galeiformis]TWU26246.1 hypothetical protein Pla52o_00990 [Novipirellula galeiformis]